MSDPVILYKDGDEKRIASIDAPAWIADGWSAEKITLFADIETPSEPVTELPLPDTAIPEAEVKVGVKRKQ